MCFPSDTAMNANKHVHDFQNTAQTYFIWGDNAVQNIHPRSIRVLECRETSSTDVCNEVRVWFRLLGQQPPQVSRATWSVFCLVDLMKPRNSSSDTARIKRALEDELRNDRSKLWVKLEISHVSLDRYQLSKLIPTFRQD